MKILAWAGLTAATLCLLVGGDIGINLVLILSNAAILCHVHWQEKDRREREEEVRRTISRQYVNQN